MPEVDRHRAIQRLLLVMPSWLGDCVMTTPTLRALRTLLPKARLTVLIRQPLRPLFASCPWIDRIVTIRPHRRGMSDTRRGSLFNLARRITRGRFDTAILFPNSFRSALIVRMAGIPRRIGYDRDGRGGLLTDRLVPRRAAGKIVPVPARDYYLGLARYLGGAEPDPTLQLFTHPTDDAAALRLLAAAGHDPASTRPLVLLNPGANYGEAKLWLPERFAQLADLLRQQCGADVALTGAPRERGILDRVAALAKQRPIDLPAAGIDLRRLKSVLRHASLMVTNDTGARHLAAALGTPVVTIFGPTDPAWTEIGFDRERQVAADVYCRPCQKKLCPLMGTPDFHICMKHVSVQDVMRRASELLALPRGAVGVAP